METALYLIPVTLGDTPYSKVIPEYNHEIVRGIKHFIVENVRSARRFLCKIDGVDTDNLEFYELNEHTDLRSITNYLDPLLKGHSMGVISEAGCPAVADPGAAVVEMAQKKNLKVVPLTGPSSILMSLMASGFSGQSFAFNGYLPAKPEERAKKLRQLEQKVYKDDQTQIFIEAPYRNSKMMETLVQVLRPDTRLCIASGITTESEFIQTKNISQWKKSKLPEIDKIPAIFLIYK